MSETLSGCHPALPKPCRTNGFIISSVLLAGIDRDPPQPHWMFIFPVRPSVLYPGEGVFRKCRLRQDYGRGEFVVSLSGSVHIPFAVSVWECIPFA